MKKQQIRLSAILAGKELSVFTRRVYQVTAAIPRGETRSYRWVARRAGRPKAYRAVGNILNKNPFMGIIPCHRVICSDGSIGGFALGIRKKKEMLRAEMRFPKHSSCQRA